jgi:hypothetical protein
MMQEDVEKCWILWRAAGINRDVMREIRKFMLFLYLRDIYTQIAADAALGRDLGIMRRRIIKK